MPLTAGTTLVTDEYVLVPASVVDPVVVKFAGQYVWSFSPPRDGVRTKAGWQVAWPEIMRNRLVGTTRVRVEDAVAERVDFDADVSFGDSDEELSFRDRNGHPLAVDKAGHLTRVFSETDDDVRRQIIEGTARVIAHLRDDIGIDAHVSYGCLLGAVRDGHMIGHDSDTDLAYLSRHTHPADIVRESYRMERELRKLGWEVVRMSGADLKLFLRLSDGRVVHVDIFGGFHVEGVFYLLGGRSGQLAREALTPASTITLEGVELAAPADPERVLEFLYGPSWRIPDPAFGNVDPRAGLRRLDGWLRGTRTDLIPWNELLRYRRAEVPKTGSAFAGWVSNRLPGDATVVDLGAGNGRDTDWFSRQGHRVISFDFSGAALRQTTRKVKRSGGEPDARVLLLNDLRSVLLAGAELSREPAAPHLYARGLVGCLDADARRNLWRLCSMSLRRGGSLFLQYAAARPDLPETQLDGLVTRVDTAALVREITSAGGRVVLCEEGPGHDFFDHSDPHVARLEVRWDPVSQATPNPQEER